MPAQLNRGGQFTALSVGRAGRVDSRFVDPEYPEKIVARFATAHPSVYVLLADSLTAMRQLLPPGLELSERLPADPPDVVEIWFSKP
jgi:hypothetical protein